MEPTAPKKTGLELMRDPFPPNQISILCRSTKKDNPKGKCNKCGGYHGLPAIALSYVGHAAITDRLLDADPNWTWEPLAFGQDGYPVIDRDGGMWIKLTVCGVTRLGYGDAQGKTGGDAMKERIGDAIRNAAMRFGAALELWHKGELHAPEPEGAEPAEPETPPAAMNPAELKTFIDGITKAKDVNTLQTLYHNAIERGKAIGDPEACAKIKQNTLARKAALEAVATVEKKAAPQDEESTYTPE